jgi:hypothetical protein
MRLRAYNTLSAARNSVEPEEGSVLSFRPWWQRQDFHQGQSGHACQPFSTKRLHREAGANEAVEVFVRSYMSPGRRRHVGD